MNVGQLEMVGSHNGREIIATLKSRFESGEWSMFVVTGPLEYLRWCQFEDESGLGPKWPGYLFISDVGGICVFSVPKGRIKKEFLEETFSLLDPDDGVREKVYYFGENENVHRFFGNLVGGGQLYYSEV